MFSGEAYLEEVFLSEAPKRTPRPVTTGKDARSFPLSPTDGFVLSRIDGALDEQDLAESTGLPEAAVQASLAKLETMGLIAFDGTPPVPPRSASIAAAARLSSVSLRAATASPLTEPSHSPATHASTPSHSPATHASTPSRSPAPSVTAPSPTAPPRTTPQPTTAPLRQTPPAPPQIPLLSPDDQASLVEDIDLEVDLRKGILEAFRTLEQRDHYALLGVPETADRKIIKRAYYELAASFHPDKYFRKRLGSFKVRMEAVFARLTIAHDTLANKASRSEYDAYLSERRISQAIEEHLEKGLAEAKQAEAIVESLVLAEDPLAVPPPVATLSPQVDLATRREMLARRLLGGHPSRPATSPGMGAARPVNPGAPGSPGGASTPLPMQGADAVSALKRRYEERMHRAKAREALKFATQAEAALASGDAVAAANAFRIAANLDTKDAELERKAAESRIKADSLLAETYMRQGRYEETQGQWPEAARSWSRVCKVSPNNPIAHERAANAAVKANGDLHAGVRFGQRACELDPKNALFRITLATCYSAAGMTLNARRELDTAAQLAPHDGTIQSMIKRVGHPA
jgi:curved DNA-binding protein CbpA